MKEENRLSEKERKFVIDLIKKQFDINEEVFSNYIFFKQRRNKIFIVEKQIYEFIKKNRLMENILKFGIKIGTLQKNCFIFNVEGAQIFGKYAKKNVIEIDNKKMKEWLKGYDIELDVKDGVYIIKNGDYILGCGKVKNKILKNRVPKERRILKDLI